MNKNHWDVTNALNTTEQEENEWLAMAAATVGTLLVTLLLLTRHAASWLPQSVIIGC
jgi:hypothetical protein